MDSLDDLNHLLRNCRRCPRLVWWREQVARQKRRAYRDQEYWGRPVLGFGDPQARVLVVGLAPGAHGANRTGRMFTGDASGDFLYAALYRAGFANQPHSSAPGDGLELRDAYITAAARCVPPDNRPTSQELAHCRPFLEREIQLIRPRILVALGRIAFDSLLRVYSLATGSALPSTLTFAHGVTYFLSSASPLLPSVTLVCSYHPSRQNTQTGRLTVTMFDAIWTQVHHLLSQQEGCSDEKSSSLG